MARKSVTKMKRKPPLGSGKRFRTLEKTLEKKPGVTSPKGLTAYIGRKELGKSKFQALAAAGRRRAARARKRAF